MVDSTYRRIYRVVATIPRGRVATYGQVAELAGIPRGARQVGYALHALRDDSEGVPWHRVLNARGEISTRFEPGFEDLQRVMLQQEGVKFDAAGRVSLERYRFAGDGDAPGRRRRKKPPAPARRSVTERHVPRSNAQDRAHADSLSSPPPKTQRETRQKRGRTEG